MAKRNRGTVLERLAAWSVPDGECIVWAGTRIPFGYGHISIDGRMYRVHRAAWIARHGEPPAATPHVLHRCDNPPCWRDDHLFLGTHADNMADKAAKGRTWKSDWTHCKWGHPFDEVNTYVHGGKRGCRICRRDANRRRAARKRLADQA